MKHKKKVIVVLFLQLTGVILMQNHLDDLKWYGYNRERESGEFEGGLQMYYQFKTAGVDIPDSIKKPSENKYFPDLGENVSKITFYYPAMFCFISSILLTGLIFCKVSDVNHEVSRVKDV